MILEGFFSIRTVTQYSEILLQQPLMLIMKTKTTNKTKRAQEVLQWDVYHVLIQLLSKKYWINGTQK